MNKKFEDVIAEQGRLVYTHVGDSMLPTIRGRDLLVIETVKEPLKVGDVPLYKRDSGQYVLHRIVAVSRGLYALKGDNRTDVETGITDKHIIGVLTGIIRNGKILPVETPQDHAARVAKYLISRLLRCQRRNSGKRTCAEHGSAVYLPFSLRPYADRCCLLCVGTDNSAAPRI